MSSTWEGTSSFGIIPAQPLVTLSTFLVQNLSDFSLLPSLSKFLKVRKKKISMCFLQVLEETRDQQVHWERTLIIISEFMHFNI